MIVRSHKGGASTNIDTRMIITFVLICIWGLRMAIHVFLRTELGKEDRRFLNLRRQLNEKGGPALYYAVAFFGIFMTNGCIITAINSSALYVSMFSVGDPINVQDIIGIIIWSIGFLILTISDHQLRVFKKFLIMNPNSDEKLCKTGLWAYSRHPNLFGESIVWWGIYLLACGVNGGWITLWSPILIFILVRFVSGVPTIE